MTKDFKILIVGFGSIGERHYNNLLTLGYKNIFVYDIDKEKTKSFSNKISVLDEKHITGFEIALISNPTNEHLKTALMAAKVGCNIFIEKPLSHNLEGIDELQKICREKNLITMIGANMRFHPSLAFIKKYLEAGKLGKVFSINHQFGYYLPYWREGVDYRKNYAAKKETGGGIILDDIHEFDLLFWFNDFAEVSEHRIISNNTGSLEIETEDQAVGTFLFKNGILGSVRCDYLSKKYTRNCLIVGEIGNLYWDFNNNDVLFLTKEKTEKIFSVDKYDVNQMYIDEIKYFFDCVESKQKTFNDISVAKTILAYLLKYN